MLSLLHDNVVSSIGDERNQQLCLKLMEAACVPYMKMLGMWICRGIISDPISEVSHFVRLHILLLITISCSAVSNRRQ